MGFVAKDAVDPLDYDFTHFVQKPGAKGTIPEPSQAAMRKYRKDIMETMKEFEDVQNIDVEKATDEEIEALQERAVEVEAKFDTLTAELCKNTPPADVLAELPFRHKILFTKWLQEQFNPGNLTPATS